MWCTSQRSRDESRVVVEAQVPLANPPDGNLLLWLVMRALAHVLLVVVPVLLVVVMVVVMEVALGVRMEIEG